MNNVTQINISYTTPNNDEYLLTDIQKVSNNVWEMTQTHYTSNNEMYSYISEYNLNSTDSITHVDTNLYGTSVVISLSNNEQIYLSSQVINGDLILYHQSTDLRFNLGATQLSTIVQTTGWGRIIIEALKIIIVWAVDEYCDSQKETHNNNLNKKGCTTRKVEDCRILCNCGSNHSNS